MECALKQLSVALVLVLGGTLPLSAQSRQPAQAISAPTIASGPVYLTVDMTSYGAWLRWPAVVNATGYRITRVAYSGQPEILISARPASSYVFEGNNCVSGDGLPTCVYLDNQFKTTAAKLTVTYRAYAVVPAADGLLTTSPSPAASVVWNCPDCAKLR